MKRYKLRAQHLDSDGGAYLCLHSPEFAAKALANNLLTRAQIVDQLIEEGKDVWDTSFIRTNVLWLLKRCTPLAHCRKE